MCGHEGDFVRQAVNIVCPKLHIADEALPSYNEIITSDKHTKQYVNVGKGGGV